MAKRARKHWWNDDAWSNLRFRNRISDIHESLVKLEEAEGEVQYEDVIALLQSPNPDKLVNAWVKYLAKRKH